MTDWKQTIAERTAQMRELRGGAPDVMKAFGAMAQAATAPKALDALGQLAPAAPATGTAD